MNNDWRDGFLFIGNHLILDFIDTRPVMKDEAVELLPDGSALGRWLGAAGLVNKGDSARLMRRWSARNSRPAFRYFGSSARGFVRLY